MKTLLFDLDGTVADPLKAFASSLFYAFDEMKIPRASIETIRTAIGPPMQETMGTIFKLPPEIHTQFMQTYRDHHGREGIYDYTIYDGMEDLLKTVHGKYKIFLATSKPHVYATEILIKAGLGKYFNHMYGAELSGVNSIKGDLINHIIKTEKLNPDECLMIGDRKHDIIGAKANNMRSCGVLWGFGDRPELEQAGAEYIVKTPKELAEIRF